MRACVRCSVQWVEENGDSIPAESVSPAPQECIRCGATTNSTKSCHQCGGVLCDYVCEEWHLEKDCEEVDSKPVAAPQEVKRYDMDRLLNAAWVAGAKVGANCVEAGNHKAFDAAIAAHSEGACGKDYVLHSEYVSLREELQKAKAEIDFWQRELANFRRNAEYRARQMAAEVLRGDVEQLVKPWRDVAEKYSAMTPPPPIVLNPQLLQRAEKAETELADMRKALKLYARHGGECEYWDSEQGGLRWRDGDEEGCTCGLAKALEVKPLEVKP
jgi:hypothetical protein